MRQFRRSDRLNAQILRDISRLLDTVLADVSSGMTTFTGVSVTRDLRYAKVYYSHLGNADSRERVDDYLNRERGWIRSQIGKNLTIRHIPELVFKYDPSVEEGIRIEKLLSEIESERNKD